jgi:thymidylate synthase
MWIYDVCYLMESYDQTLEAILKNGTSRTNKRTGIKTRSLFGVLNRFRLDQGGEPRYFPLLTRRKIYPKSVFAELLWFLSGSTSNKDLQKLGCNFWNPWVDHAWEEKMGYTEDVFGPVYGFQLRHFGGNYNHGIHDCNYGFGGFDQLKFVIERIKEDPSCRRTLWTLWNPQDVHKMRLPPCHMMYQVLVDDDRKLTGILYQRSVDYPIGAPANIQFYSALTIMIAQQTDCVPYEFVHMTADTHIYEDQIEGVKQYLGTSIYGSPKVQINKASDIFSYQMSDFVISDYLSGPKIDIPVAV